MIQEMPKLFNIRIVLLVCIVSLMQTAYALSSSAHAVHASRTPQGAVVSPPREPVLKDHIESRLRRMYAAVRTNYVRGVVKYQDQLLQCIQRDHDLLWQIFKQDEYPAEKKLIDCIAPFELALWASRRRGRACGPEVDHVCSSELGHILSDTFKSCLLLSRKSILEPKPCQGYLRQLIEDQKSYFRQEELQAKLKIQLTLEYLGTAARYDAFTQAAPQALPDDLMRLIASFCFGITPQTRVQTKKEVVHMEKRKRSRWHELGLFSKNCMQGFVDYADRKSPFPLSQDKKILRAFVWADLTEKDLSAQLTRPIKGALRECRNTGVTASICALTALGYFLPLFMGSRESPLTIGTLCTGFFCVAFGIFFACSSLILGHSYCSKKRRFEKTLQSKQQAFLEQWPQLVRAINEARLSFEEGIDDLPDIIPACNAVASTSS